MQLLYCASPVPANSASRSAARENLNEKEVMSAMGCLTKFRSERRRAARPCDAAKYVIEIRAAHGGGAPRCRAATAGRGASWGPHSCRAAARAAAPYPAPANSSRHRPDVRLPALPGTNAELPPPRQRRASKAPDRMRRLPPPACHARSRDAGSGIARHRQRARAAMLPRAMRTGYVGSSDHTHMPVVKTISRALSSAA